MKEVVNVHVIDESFLSSDNIVALIAIIVALFTFIFERIITARREKKNDKYNWFLTVIIEPQLPNIRDFYDKTHTELRESIDLIKNLPSNSTISEQIIAKRERIQLFKSRRASYANNFVSMLSSYDRKLEIQIDRVLNLLDDIYAQSLDNTDETNEALSIQIYRNQTLFYKILFSEISKNN